MSYCCNFYTIKLYSTINVNHIFLLLTVKLAKKCHDKYP